MRRLRGKKRLLDTDMMDHGVQTPEALLFEGWSSSIELAVMVDTDLWKFQLRGADSLRASLSVSYCKSGKWGICGIGC